MLNDSRIQIPATANSFHETTGIIAGNIMAAIPTIQTTKSEDRPTSDQPKTYATVVTGSGAGESIVIDEMDCIEWAE